MESFGMPPGQGALRLLHLFRHDSMRPFVSSREVYRERRLPRGVSVNVSSRNWVCSHGNAEADMKTCPKEEHVVASMTEEAEH